MSGLIKTVSYQSENQQKLAEKLAPMVGTGVVVSLVNGSELKGVIEEVGQDYVSLLALGQEEVRWMPLTSILYLRPLVQN